jgi:hypothetical protein
LNEAQRNPNAICRPPPGHQPLGGGTVMSDPEKVKWPARHIRHCHLIG